MEGPVPMRYASELSFMAVGSASPGLFLPLQLEPAFIGLCHSWQTTEQHTGSAGGFSLLRWRRGDVLRTHDHMSLGIFEVLLFVHF